MPLPVYDNKLLPTYTNVAGLRRFVNPNIQAAVDSALSELGPNDQVAVVAHQVYNADGTVVTNKTMLSAVARTKDQKWSVMVAGYKDWSHGDLGGEAKVVWKPF